MLINAFPKKGFTLFPVSALVPNSKPHKIYSHTICDYIIRKDKNQQRSIIKI